MPGVPGAAAPRGLFLGDHDSPVRLSLLSQQHGDGIGGIGLEEMVDTLPERSRREPLAQNFRSENVRHFFDLIAVARVALHANAESSKSFDPTPHSRTGHAYFAGNFRAADDDHGVVGKQRQERVNPAIGRTRQGCLCFGHSGKSSDAALWVRMRADALTLYGPAPGTPISRLAV